MSALPLPLSHARTGEPTTLRDDTAARHRAKYENRNLIHRATLGRFQAALGAMIDDAAPRDVLEFGCGEGFLARALLAQGTSLPGYRGIDLREEAIEEAREINPDRRFDAVDVFDASLDAARPDLLLASQVLEHLYEPDRYLARLAEIAGRTLILTVPHEPWFRLMNLARGRDVARLGNHPEHVNHWSPRSFAATVRRHARVTQVRAVFPFVLLRAEVPLRPAQGGANG